MLEDAIRDDLKEAASEYSVVPVDHMRRGLDLSGSTTLTLFREGQRIEIPANDIGPNQ